MAGVSTFVIEFTRLGKRIGWNSGDTATLVYLKQWVNDAYRDVCEAHDWPWLHYEGTVELRAAYDTGTATIVNDTTDYVTTTGTWSTSWSPMRIRTAGGNDYKLTYNAGNTRWEMDRDLVEAESAVSYTLYKDRYDLAARLRSLYMAWESAAPGYPPQFVDPVEMAALKSPGIVKGSPIQALCFVDADSTNIVSAAEVYPVPNDAHTLHYKGFRQVADLSADADVFLFPGGLLSTFRARADFYAYSFRGNDKAADRADLEYEKKLARAIGRSDPSAGAGDKVILDPRWFTPMGYADDTPRAGRG